MLGMSLPHEPYTPPGQQPQERKTMSVRRLAKHVPYVESHGHAVSDSGIHGDSLGDAKVKEAKGTGLHKAMKQGDMNTIPPVHVDTRGQINKMYGGGAGSNAKLALGNGGHRVASAYDLGWKRMRITSHPGESGKDYIGTEDTPEDEQQDRQAPPGYLPHQVLSQPQFATGERTNLSKLGHAISGDGPWRKPAYAEVLKPRPDIT
jgi:hypothetical protein